MAKRTGVEVYVGIGNDRCGSSVSEETDGLVQAIRIATAQATNLEVVELTRGRIVLRDKFTTLVKFMVNLEGFFSFTFSLIVLLLSSVVLALATLLSSTVGDSYGVLAGLLVAGILMITGWRLFPLSLIAFLGVIDAIWNTFWVYRMIGIPRNYFRTKIVAYLKLKQG